MKHSLQPINHLKPNESMLSRAIIINACDKKKTNQN
jgi:hypothetical protein